MAAREAPQRRWPALLKRLGAGGYRAVAAARATLRPSRSSIGWSLAARPVPSGEEYSLGARLALEAVKVIEREHPHVVVEHVILLAPAVPVGLCEVEFGYGPAVRRQRFEVVMHSRNDTVLRRAFPPGQRLARRAQINGHREPSPRGQSAAVGYTGMPTSRWSGERESCGLRHGDYWHDGQVMNRVSKLFGETVPHAPAVHHMPMRTMVDRVLPSWTPPT